LQKNSRATISVFAIAAFLFGVASIALGIPFFIKQSAVVRNWPTAMASVRTSEIVQITQGGQKLWATRFEMNFDANGQNVVTIVNGYRQSALRDNLVEAAGRYPVGSTHLIRYDPNNPSEIRLDTDQPRRYYQLPIALAITGIIFIAISLALFYVTKL
jgi:Protein of unknown function (DUF3592)